MITFTDPRPLILASALQCLANDRKNEHFKAFREWSRLHRKPAFRRTDADLERMDALMVIVDRAEREATHCMRNPHALVAKPGEA